MRNQGKVWNFILWTALALVLGIFFGLALLPLLGVNSVEALKIMVSGVFEDRYTMGNILVKTTPLILSGLAFAFTFKANLYNIGVQGQFYMGCICAVATSLAFMTRMPGWIVMILAMAAACIGGGLVGLIIGWLKAKFNANEFLVSMMSTYVITYFMNLLLRTKLQESKHEYMKTDTLDQSVWLPKLIQGTSVSWGFVIAVATAILIWFVLYKTTLGYRIRVTGMNSSAGSMSGIEPARQYMIAFLISGAIAGLAGFVEVNGMQHMLLTDFDANVGSYGIGIAIMANAHPLGIMLSALLIGGLQVAGTVLSHASDAPASIIDLILGFVMFFVLISFFFRDKIDYRRELRQKIKSEEAEA